MIRIILSIVFVIICVALSAIILLQEGKSQGLGSIGGMADTYWGRNKGRSMEGKLEKFTKYGAILFFHPVIGTESEYTVAIKHSCGIAARVFFSHYGKNLSYHRLKCR